MGLPSQKNGVKCDKCNKYYRCQSWGRDPVVTVDAPVPGSQAGGAGLYSRLAVTLGPGGLVSWNIDQSQAGDTTGGMAALLCNIITTSPCITQLEASETLWVIQMMPRERGAIQSTCNYLEGDLFSFHLEGNYWYVRTTSWACWACSLFSPYINSN